MAPLRRPGGLCVTAAWLHCTPSHSQVSVQAACRAHAPEHHRAVRGGVERHRVVAARIGPSGEDHGDPVRAIPLPGVAAQSRRDPAGVTAEEHGATASRIMSHGVRGSSARRGGPGGAPPRRNLRHAKRHSCRGEHRGCERGEDGSGHGLRPDCTSACVTKAPLRSMVALGAGSGMMRLRARSGAP